MDRNYYQQVLRSARGCLKQGQSINQPGIRVERHVAGLNVVLTDLPMHKAANRCAGELTAHLVGGGGYPGQRDDFDKIARRSWVMAIQQLRASAPSLYGAVPLP